MSFVPPRGRFAIEPLGNPGFSDVHLWWTAFLDGETNVSPTPLPFDSSRGLRSPRSLCPREESNLYRGIRNPMFYPLNYGGFGDAFTPQGRNASYCNRVSFSLPDNLRIQKIP